MNGERFSSYAPQDVILENLSELEERDARLWEQRTAHLKELAEELTEELSDVSELLFSLSDRRPFTGDPRASTEASDDLHSTYLRFSRVSDTVRLSKELCTKIAQRRDLTPSLFLSPIEETPLPNPLRIAYLRNPMADDAFLRFSAALDQPRVFYVPTFAAACEEVWNGRCTFALLPMESTGEGRLSSFSRLIDRYGLRILMTTEIQSSDGLRRTVFALLGRELRFFSMHPQEPHTLELSVSNAEAHPIEELLFAARLCGLRLMHVDTVFDALEESTVVLHPRFEVGDAELCSFLCFLAMEATECEVVGFYVQI